MQVRWLVISMLVAGVAALGLLARSRLGRKQEFDAGAVSERWVSEHRADTSHL
jgi:hypothetical protein